MFSCFHIPIPRCEWLHPLIPDSYTSTVKEPLRQCASSAHLTQVTIGTIVAQTEGIIRVYISSRGLPGGAGDTDSAWISGSGCGPSTSTHGMA